ncbi:MAG: baseplate J/gp47 family protein [Marinisporobacter sp.]|jgi:hypothetical protein|nr:baseplate J/gp47 family protein [Marinisporobacter sp.]
MIRLPKLDDQNYRDIVNHARNKVAKLVPEWTDYNVHDPGITLIELFAWLKEMQQFHLDKITSKNQMKFLKLLGIRPSGNSPSKAKVVFEKCKEEVIIPKNTRFASDGFVFESTEEAFIGLNKMKKTVVFDGETYLDVSKTQLEEAVSFYAFGKEQRKDSILYLGWEKGFVKEKKYKFWINVFDEHPVERNPFISKNSMGLNHISWEILSEGRWMPIDLSYDDTHGFLVDGVVEFEVRNNASKESLFFEEEPCYWMRVKLNKPGCEESPKILKIYNDFTQVHQIKTLSESHEIIINENNPSVILDTWLSMFGEIEVQYEIEKNKWMDLEDAKIEYLKENRKICSGRCKFEFEKILDEENTYKNYRMIFSEPSFKGSRIVGSSNGMPHQKFFVKDIHRVMRRDAILQVGEILKNGKIIWTNWTYTDELEIEPNNKYCFTINDEREEIVFGDGENGVIPPIGKQNIRLISCKITGGALGNITRGEINRIENAHELGINEDSFKIHNVDDCMGGKDDDQEELIDQLKLRLRSLKRAVTLKDYEDIVKLTPGLRIDQVKAVTVNDGKQTIVKIVVMPYSEKKKPIPNEAFIKAIKMHLEKYRLIGTVFEMVLPQYIEVNIYVEAVSNKIMTDEVVDSIKDHIEEFFQFKGVQANRKFGDAIFESDLMSLISKIDDVDYVRKISISAKGGNWKRLKSGDMHVPFNVMACVGELEVNLREE